MPYQNDMMSLADVVGPAYAAQQAGIQNEQNQTAEGLKNAVAMQQAPAEAQKPGLLNALTQAQTYAEQGVGMQQNAKGLTDMFAAPSAAKAAVSGNELKVSQDQLTKLGQLGQMANAIAARMDNVPPAARPAMMQQITQQYGIKPDDLGPLMNGDPDMLRHAATNMIQGSAAYQTSMSEQALKNQGATDVAGIQASGRVAAAEASANARIEAAQLAASIREKQQTFEQAAVAASKAGNQEAYKMYSQLALQAKQAAAGITSQMVTGQPLMIPDMAQPTGAAPSGAPAAPQQPGGGNSLEAEMRKRGFIK